MTLIEMTPGVVDGLIQRAGDPLRERWWRQVESCGFCSRPIRLKGHVVREHIVRPADEVCSVIGREHISA